LQSKPRNAQPHDVLLLQHFVDRPEQLGQSPELHVQLPLSQTRLFVQTFPHEPQLLLSVCSFTHVAPQPVYPLLQVYVHAPFEHAGFAFVTLVVHAVADPHCPVAAQLSTLVPEHVV
jgi:hypothetical protein